MRPTTFSHTVLGVAFLILGWGTSTSFAEITPQQVLIVANANNRDSIAVAEHYAARRGIPAQQIAKLNLPQGETMSRTEFDRKLVRPLRDILQARGHARSIRVLVTVYGIPLRVAPPSLSAEERQWHTDASDRLARVQSTLREVALQASGIAPSTGSHPPPSLQDDPSALAYDRHITFLTKVDETVQSAIQRVASLPPPTREHWRPRLERMSRQHQGLAGLAHVHYDVFPGRTSPEPPTDTLTRTEYVAGLQILANLLEIPIQHRRSELYEQIERVYGAYGVFALAALELRALSDEQSDASVDSELSLLWWDRPSQGLTWRTPNPLYYANKPLSGHTPADIPLLMVSRLDATTADTARHLVDLAIEAEPQGPQGRIYLDARGLADNPGDFYARYDQSLRELQKFLSQRTPYHTILENTESRFQHPGQAPDVAVYVGWYRLRHYEDAFTFRPGAIGYHIASGEAVSIHTAAETGWCKNALERGITATLGSIGEPYLDAFPEPLEFVALLTTGQYSLVEAYYLTTRWVSWRMVLFGDPLYNPWKASPAAKRSALTMFPLAPIPPSDQPFNDPWRAREELHRRQEQARAKLDMILRQAMSLATSHE